MEHFLPGHRPLSSAGASGAGAGAGAGPGGSLITAGNGDSAPPGALAGRAAALARAVGGAYPFAASLAGLVDTYAELLGRLREDGLVAPAPVQGPLQGFGSRCASI